MNISISIIHVNINILPILSNLLILIGYLIGINKSGKLANIT